jgi:peptide/nickel transport system permease protein
MTEIGQATPAPRAEPRRTSTATLAGLTGVIAFTMLGITGSWLTPYRTSELAGASLEPPSAAHLLGTNSVGQDLMSQLVTGARVSLLVALLAGGGTVLLGASIGMLAGWTGGRLDAVAMRTVDLVLAIPRLPLLIVVGAYAGPSISVISLTIALTFWPMSARVVRSQVLSLRRRTHLRASLGFGAGTSHALRRHVLPEVGLIVAAGLVAASGRAVMLEAGLAFLGLGDPARTSWGKTMRDAMDFGGLFHTDAWTWWLLPPVAAITLLLLAITLLGVGVEQRVNPRLTRHPGGGR